MGYLFFSGHGAREEAGTAGDEIEAVAAAKVVTYGRKFIHIYLYICTEARSSATTKSRQQRLRSGYVRT